jgi:hypothetical protein
MLTAFDHIKDDLKKDLFFEDKTIQVLLKPVKHAGLADIAFHD